MPYLRAVPRPVSSPPPGRYAECGTPARSRCPRIGPARVVVSFTSFRTGHAAPPAFGCPTSAVGGSGAFALSGIVGIMHTRGGRKTGLPFVPCRFSAAILALFLPRPIVNSYRQLTGR